MPDEGVSGIFTNNNSNNNNNNTVILSVKKVKAYHRAGSWSLRALKLENDCGRRAS